MLEEPRSADGEEGSTSQQASAKRTRHLKRTDPLKQTQAAAMHAGHAEPAGSAAQIPRPAAADAGKRYVQTQQDTLGRPIWVLGRGLTWGVDHIIVDLDECCRTGVRRKAAARKQAGGPVRRSERLSAKR
ncbi:hypothetical protein ABBQ38_012101 [Trebouxia sp. C0009 RCD-2024]